MKETNGAKRAGSRKGTSLQMLEREGLAEETIMRLGTMEREGRDQHCRRVHGGKGEEPNTPDGRPARTKVGVGKTLACLRSCKQALLLKGGKGE